MSDPRGGSARDLVQPETRLLDHERRRVETALRAIARRSLAGYPDTISEPVEYALATQGKRLRPILCVAAYAASRPTESVPNAAYRLACALEIIHTYSLIHDDLPCMDDDDLRRGRPTVHRVYGSARATLAGAALLPLAVDVVEVDGVTLGLDDAERRVLLIELTRAAGAEGMAGGQLLDLESEQQGVDSVTLESIHRLKTGALLTASLRVGALAGRARPQLLDALTAYGNALGLAFQITDDILDVEGTPAVTGKTTGRDVALRKASYPALHGLEAARALAREKAADAKGAIAGLELPTLDAIADFVVERTR